MEVKKVCVLGAGTMGSGIAQICAQAGYEVTMRARRETSITSGKESIRKAFNRSVEKGRMTKEDADAALNRVKTTTVLEEAAKGADLVIEAILEIMEEKKKVYATLDEVCPKHAILASNTSSLSILDIAMATKRPEKVMGMHFFNPVPMMRLIELVKTIVTSEETFNTVKAVSEKLGKTTITAQDTPGFIVNRLLIPYILDGVRLLEAGVATKEDIDQSMKLGCNHPMGPLELADLIGLDIIKDIGDAMYAEFKDTGCISPVLLNKLVVAGRLGRKSGEGFYNYQK